MLCDLGLREWNPAAEPKQAKTANAVRPAAPKKYCVENSPAAKSESHEEPAHTATAKAEETMQVSVPAKRQPALRAPVPAKTRREVWQVDFGRCRNCGSKYALEIDHIFPISCGGPSTSENLRRLCRACNQRAAIEKFGMEKMEAHLH